METEMMEMLPWTNRAHDGEPQRKPAEKTEESVRYLETKEGRSLCHAPPVGEMHFCLIGPACGGFVTRVNGLRHTTIECPLTAGCWLLARVLGL